MSFYQQDFGLLQLHRGVRGAGSKGYSRSWERVKEELQETIPPSSFEPWILPLEPMGFENGEFSVLTGQAFAITIIRKNHYSQIQEAFKKVLGQNVELKIILDEKLSQKLKKEIEKSIRKNNVITSEIEFILKRL